MYGLYTPVLLLQAFCVYHAYRNNAEPRWYWVILLLPLVGSIIYLIYCLGNRSTFKTITANVKENAGSNYRITELEKAVEFTDSVTNKENLADAYMEAGRYRDAIPLYVSCLQGFMADDPALRMKLLYACFMDGDYPEAIRLGQELESEKIFKNAEERLAYAWSLYHHGDHAAAERVFQDVDRTFTNYLHRFEYCKFLIRTNKRDAAKEKLSELLQEFEQMQDGERRQKRSIQHDIRALYEHLAAPA